MNFDSTRIARARTWLTMLLLATLATPAIAQSGGTYDLTWNTIAGGGGTASGPSFDSFQLTYCLGQSATSTLSGGVFTITGGFMPELGLQPACLADVDNGSRTGTPDQAVTIDDLIFFLILFEDGDVRGDLDNGSHTGVPDGGVTIEDLVYFLYRFELGC